MVTTLLPRTVVVTCSIFLPLKSLRKISNLVSGTTSIFLGFSNRNCQISKASSFSRIFLSPSTSFPINPFLSIKKSVHLKYFSSVIFNYLIFPSIEVFLFFFCLEGVLFFVDYEFYVGYFSSRFYKFIA